MEEYQVAPLTTHKAITIQYKEHPMRSTSSTARKYVPGLAQFYFYPEYDWSVEDARRLYHTREKPHYNTIRYADCIRGMKSLPSGSIDAIVADPPFGINFSGKESFYNRDSNLVLPGYVEVIGDYERFSQSWIGELPRLMKDSASAFIISGYTNLEFIERALRLSGLHTINHIIWHYSFGPHVSKKFVSSHYHILFIAKKPNKRFFNRLVFQMGDVWKINRRYRPGRKKNGTCLPLSLVQRMIEYVTRPGDLVLDPFMGNATTAVAAKSTFRHFYGFEINDSLRPVVEEELGQVILGEAYSPYITRLGPLSRLAEKYGPAYEEYMKKDTPIPKWLFSIL